MSNFVFPDITICLIGILGLLVVWQYYKMQIMAGRILAVDIFDRSGIRMYLYATPDDSQVCDTCAQANGRVYLSSKVARKKKKDTQEPTTEAGELRTGREADAPATLQEDAMKTLTDPAMAEATNGVPAPSVNGI